MFLERSARSRAFFALRAVTLGILLVWEPGAAAGQDNLPPPRAPQDAVADLLPRIAALTGRMDIAIEHSEMRLNRCSPAGGKDRDDVFYVWAGLRGIAANADAGAMLEALHDDWQAAGWQIGRYRHLPNGGVNLAATEPATGNWFSLDSGFEPDPGRYIVGIINTPCFHAGEDVAFGALRDVAP